MSVPVLDVVATKSENGRKLYVSIINRSPKEDVNVKIVWEDGELPKHAVWRCIGADVGDDLFAYNTLKRPDKVRLSGGQEVVVRHGMFVAPGHSVGVLEFEI